MFYFEGYHYNDAIYMQHLRLLYTFGPLREGTYSREGTSLGHGAFSFLVNTHEYSKQNFNI